MKSYTGSATMASEPSAIVLDIQRMSTEDGPGIRTTVFFKGCSLKCKWCHNPESIPRKPQVQWLDSKCLGCGTCIDSCPSGALLLTPGGVGINRLTCDGCGTCADVCPAGAMERLGNVWSVEGLTREVIKDRAYFEKSGGGVTVSGGEPGLQSRFVGTFLERLTGKGIHTAFDTCGLCSTRALDRILPHASVVLFDIKTIDSETHRQFTGEPNEKILMNLLHTADRIRNHPDPAVLWIRTPVIPGMTDSEDTVAGIGSFISDNLEDVLARWELCAFNTLCRDKYLRLGRDWIFKDQPPLRRETLDRLAEVAGRSLANPDRVVWTGATRLDETPVRPSHSK